MLCYRLTFDIGGTFTDFALLNEESGAIAVNKRLTTSQDPSVAMLEGTDELLRAQDIDLAQITQIVSATTLPTNTVVQRTGEKTALITTRGFRDILEMQRGRRYNFFDLYVDRPFPLVPRHYIWEVSERVNADGKVLVKLDSEEVRTIVAEIVARGVKTVAVCLLHAYRNPEHERLIQKVILEESPDLMVSISSEVSPIIREYERTSTTVINAYIMPVMKGHLGKISDGLKGRGYNGDISVMQSSGGITDIETAANFPVRVVGSGPTAGVFGAAFFGRMAGFDNIISFDMGGTTAKIGLIEGGRPAITNEFEIAQLELNKEGSGLPINIPAVDIVDIGAGGGSISCVKMGLITVGPDSAGASPGPICYQMGGTEPTVTDANLVLGYLNPDYFLGGKMQLDVDAAAHGIEEQIARPLGLSVAEAAWDIHEIVTDSMARTTRLVSVERGRDPRLFSLAACGGAGPLHGARLAKSIGIPRVICPARAGVASALGLLSADMRFDLSRTLVSPLDETIIEPLQQLYQEMEAEAAAMVQQAKVKGDVLMTRWADMRYIGQGSEVITMLPAVTFTLADLPTLKKAFHDAYANLYGYSEHSQIIEGVNWKLTVTCVVPKPLFKKDETKQVPTQAALKRKRKCYFPEFKDYIDCDIYDRYRLAPGAVIQGPAIIEERETTIVLPPGDTAHVDEYANMIIEVKI